jgi:hypothetical protein
MVGAVKHSERVQNDANSCRPGGFFRREMLRPFPATQRDEAASPKNLLVQRGLAARMLGLLLAWKTKADV